MVEEGSVDGSVVGIKVALEAIHNVLGRHRLTVPERDVAAQSKRRGEVVVAGLPRGREIGTHCVVRVESQ